MPKKFACTESNKKEIDIWAEQKIISYYNMGLTAEEIAEKFEYTYTQTRRVIDNYENSKKKPEELEKAYYRKPEIIYPVIDKTTGKVYYDITDFMIDRPCIYSKNK